MEQLLLFLLCSMFCLASSASLHFLHVPGNVRLPESSVIYSSSVAGIDGALLGVSADAAPEWLNAGRLFDRPEALVVYAVTADDVSANVHLPSEKFFVLQEDGATDFGSVFGEVQRAFADQRHYVAEVAAEGVDGNVLGVSDRVVGDAVRFNESQRLDLELAQLRRVTSHVCETLHDLHNGVPDFFLFHVDGVHATATLSSDVLLDSGRLLQPMETVVKAIRASAQAFEDAYAGNAVIQVLITNGLHVRKPRAKAAVPAAPRLTPTTYRFYSPDYPVIFNIVLWTTVCFAVAVLMIGVGMWSIDPGRDSIIYRMTMTRAKKD